MRRLSLIPIVAILIALMSLSGCDQAALMDKVATPEKVETAKHYIDLLRNHQYDLIEKDLDPSIKPANIQEILAGMAATIPSQEPISEKVVGAQTFTLNTDGKTSTTTNITFEYEYPDKWLLANVATQHTETGFIIVGFRINPMPDSLENTNRFTLSGKQALHYLVLTLAVLIPLFILFALVLCVRTKMEKYKWLWILFIIVGIGQFSVNWATGQWAFSPFSIQIMGVGAFAPLFGPWILTVSLPLGAIVFLFRRKALMPPQADSPKTSTPEITE